MLRQKKRWSQIERTAYHEAGHAVMAYIRKRRITSVTIVPTDKALGQCFIAKWPETDELYFEVGDITDEDSQRGRTRRETLIMVFYAGVLAESVLIGRMGIREVMGAHSDLMYVNGLMSRMWIPNEEQAEYYLQWLWYRTKGLLELPQYWTAVVTLAEELLRLRKIGGRRTREIIFQAFHRWLDRKLKDLHGSSRKPSRN